MADKLDFKKEFKDLYLPGKKPIEIEVPPIRYFMMDGKGEPLGESYQNAMSVLYSLTFTVKMSKMGSWQPEGYVDYVLPPLEGLWDVDPTDVTKTRDDWTWTSMIRQPDFVTEEVFQWALEQAKRKNPKTNYDGVRLQVWQEGLCVQAMHIGPYSEEPTTVAAIYEYMKQNSLAPDYTEERRHHEIYMSDPRKSKPENRRTVLRLPAKRV